MTTNPQATLYESRLVDGETWRATTGFFSLTDTGTRSVLVENPNADVQQIISAIKVSSDGPIKVTIYENPDSTSGGSDITIQNNTIGEPDVVGSIEVTDDISFTGGDIRDGDLQGSASDVAGSEDAVNAGSSLDGFASITDGGQMVIEVENTGTSSHETIVTIIGLKF